MKWSMEKYRMSGFSAPERKFTQAADNGNLVGVMQKCARRGFCPRQFERIMRGGSYNCAMRYANALTTPCPSRLQALAARQAFAHAIKTTTTKG